jgi:hypothetical protein
MTQVVQPTSEPASADTERVNHWINGSRFAGASGRSGPVYNPATGDLAPPDDDALGPPVPGACEAGAQSVLSEITDSLGNVNTNSWAKGTGATGPAVSMRRRS